MKKRSLVAVSYLNTKPLLHGIVHEGLDQELDIQLEIPSVCAAKLEQRKVDFGLIPVAAIPSLSSPHIISDFCIGTERTVRTVCIFSDVPIEKIDKIYLDFHSRTSVQLCQILCEEYWKITPEFIPAQEGFFDHIQSTTAALVIGDRTIALEEKHPYIYDLGEAWYDHTGLPFVFAAWVSHQKMDDDFIARFNAAMQVGVEMIPQLIYLLPKPDPNFDLETYFTENISYHLDSQKRAALDLFLKKIEKRSLQTA